MEDVRRLQAVNGDHLRSPLNLDGVGFVAPVEDLVGADIRGVEGSPEGTRTEKDMQGGGQILENESRWRSMPGCWYGAKLPNVDPQPGREVGDVSARGGGRGEEFPW
jgi:hypothetical protein